MAHDVERYHIYHTNTLAVAPTFCPPPSSHPLSLASTRALPRALAGFAGLLLLFTLSLALALSVSLALDARSARGLSLTLARAWGREILFLSRLVARGGRSLVG